MAPHGHEIADQLKIIIIIKLHNDGKSHSEIGEITGKKSGNNFKVFKTL